MRTKTMCDQCGQTDDHPKHHYGEKTYHHDCTPVPAREETLAGAHSAGDEVTGAVFAACIDEGLRGDDLRTRIEELHEGVEVGG